MEAVSISETSVNLYQTTHRNIPEDSYLHMLCIQFKSPFKRNGVFLHALTAMLNCWRKIYFITSYLSKAFLHTKRKKKGIYFNIFHTLT
jgi:hypothetical protein